MRIQGLRKIGLAIAVAVLGGHVHAQISFSSAVDLALKNDPRLKAAQADVDKAHAGLSQAHDIYVPSISANGGIGDSVGVPLSLPVIFSVSAQSLVYNFSQEDYIRSARAALDAAVLTEQEVHDQVAEDAALTYLHLDNAQRRRDAMEQEYAASKHLVTIVQDRVDAGQDARIELLRARRSADATQLEELQLEDEIASLSDHLSHLIGLPGSVPMTIGSSIPKLTTVDPIGNNTPVTYGIYASLADAHSKQEKAFGDKHYWGKPQISLGASFSRVSTIGTNYSLYYTGFAQSNISLNSLSLGIEVKIPLLDMAHQAEARESAAEARHSMFVAESQRIQFLEGRLKLGRSTAELSAAEKLAEDDQALAQDQLDTILLQISSSSTDPDKPVLTPKDEQTARVQERERAIDLLNRQFELQQVQINLLRQTNQLDDWLRSSVSTPAYPGKSLTIP
jgi:outer membrane protein TolC